MNTLIGRRPAGFDYNFRPRSYFDDLDPSTLIVASILGEERRRDVEQRLRNGDFDPTVWGEWLTDSQLDDGLRRFTGSVHPAFMGGEYLPPLRQNEIEIARIVLASVMQDVISVRARRIGSRIYYSVHDEYDIEFVPCQRSSRGPLSLAELIRFIDTTPYPGYATDRGLAWTHVQFQIELDCVEEARTFVAVDSAFYPMLGKYYDGVIADYFEALESRPADPVHRDAQEHADELSVEGPKSGKSGGRR
jgi:hypothetical protein